MKWKSLLIAFFSFMVLCVPSCVAAGGSSTDSTVNSNDSEVSSYEKDEDGFCVLEDGYFDNSVDPSDKGEVSQVKVAPLCDGIDIYKKMRLYVAGVQVPLYQVMVNESHAFDAEAKNRIQNAYASVSLKGKAEFSLQCGFNPQNDCTIRPSSLGVSPKFDENRRVVKFTITTPGQYTIEFRSSRALHLFVDELKEETYNSSNCVYFGPGIHDSSNDSRINSSNIVNLKSNQTAYLASGAFVKATFSSYSSSNVSILGPGVILLSGFTRSVDPDEHTLGIDLSFVTGARLQDFSIIDPAGWGMNLYFDSDVDISNCKIISSRANGDGISVQSCQDVHVSGCFVRTYDDSLVVKNYPMWSDKSVEGVTKNIHFESCLIWTDLAQSMEVGYETVGETMEDILFNDITVLHNNHLAIFSIHNANNAHIKNVTFSNITVENADEVNNGGKRKILDFCNIFHPTWSVNHKVTSLGDIDGVNVKNVKVIKAVQGLCLSINGTSETRSAYPNVEHLVKNVSIEDFEIYGSVLARPNDIIDESLDENVSFTKSGDPVTGASIKTSDVSSFGSNIQAI